MLVKSGIRARKKQEKVTINAREFAKKRLQEINEIDTHYSLTRKQLTVVIETMENFGEPFIQACKMCGFSPSRVLCALDKIDNIDLLQRYYSARVLLAEWYLDRRELLEKQLLNGDIDVATYQALAGDYMKLASKLAPLAYGDKIAFEVNNNNVKLSVDANAIKHLNDLINNASTPTPLLTAPNSDSITEIQNPTPEVSDS